MNPFLPSLDQLDKMISLLLWRLVRRDAGWVERPRVSRLPSVEDVRRHHVDRLPRRQRTVHSSERHCRNYSLRVSSKERSCRAHRTLHRRGSRRGCGNRLLDRLARCGRGWRRRPARNLAGAAHRSEVRNANRGCYGRGRHARCGWRGGREGESSGSGLSVFASVTRLRFEKGFDVGILFRFASPKFLYFRPVSIFETEFHSSCRSCQAGCRNGRSFVVGRVQMWNVVDVVVVVVVVVLFGNDSVWQILWGIFNCRYTRLSVFVWRGNFLIHKNRTFEKKQKKKNFLEVNKVEENKQTAARYSNIYWTF